MTSVRCVGERYGCIVVLAVVLPEHLSVKIPFNVVNGELVSVKVSYEILCCAAARRTSGQLNRAKATICPARLYRERVSFLCRIHFFLNCTFITLSGRSVAEGVTVSTPFFQVYGTASPSHKRTTPSGFATSDKVMLS